MDRISPSEGGDAGSIPAKGTNTQNSTAFSKPEGGTHEARPTLWVLLYLFLQNWSIYTIPLEPTLSKIPNERKPRHCFAPLGNTKEKCSLHF